LSVLLNFILVDGAFISIIFACIGKRLSLNVKKVADNLIYVSILFVGSFCYVLYL